MIRQTGLAFLLMASAAFAQESHPEAQKLVTIGSSVSEIVAELGAMDRVIARDSTSTYPEAMAALPDVGYIRALSPEGVLALDPDLILSERGAGPVEAVDVLRAAGIPFVEVAGDDKAEGVSEKVRSVGQVLGLGEKAEALAVEIERGLEGNRADAALVQTPKKVLFVLSVQGGAVMVGGAGSSAEAMIELAGGKNAVSGIQGYKAITDEAILEAAPDVILMMDRSGEMSVDAETVMGHPALSRTPAAEKGAILRMDGVLLLGFGPRTPQAARTLFTQLYPELAQ